MYCTVVARRCAGSSILTLARAKCAGCKTGKHVSKDLTQQERNEGSNQSVRRGALQLFLPWKHSQILLRWLSLSLVSQHSKRPAHHDLMYEEPRLSAVKWRLRLSRNEEEYISDASDNDETIVWSEQLSLILRGTLDKNSPFDICCLLRRSKI